MVEIVLLYFLCKAIGDVLMQKGRMAIGYQCLAVLLWFVGEIGAGIAFAVFVVLSGGSERDLFGATAYLVALGGALGGGGLGYLIALLIPPAADPTLDGGYEFAPSGAMASAAATPGGDNPYNAYEDDYSNLSTARFLQKPGA